MLIVIWSNVDDIGEVTATDITNEHVDIVGTPTESTDVWEYEAMNNILLSNVSQSFKKSTKSSLWYNMTIKCIPLNNRQWWKPVGYV